MLTLRISVDRARVGRGRAWIEESGIVERGQDAWSWLRRDERGRIVGLVVASVAMSIAVSLLATALVRMIEHRRVTGAADEGDVAAEAEAHVEAEPATTEAPAAEQAAEPAEA